MVFQSGDECDRCHKNYQSTFHKHRKLYLCYEEDKQSIFTICGNDFRCNVAQKSLLHVTDQIGEEEINAKRRIGRTS